MSTKRALKFLSFAALIFLFTNSTFRKEKDPLNKRKYDIILIEVKDGVNGKKGASDELEFKDGKVFSTYLFDKFEYKWLKYKITTDSTYTDETETEINYFEVESTYTDAKDQTFIMTLKIDNFAIDGEIKITKNDKLKKMFVFNGKEKYSKPKKKKDDKDPYGQ
ncbi:MAG TPA: hypothetical protein VN026_17675 [Bacteroidia bacterium]|jgi:hypothetical protein|nr:hypothetical protein [Bacteroidia bacterium]